LSPFSNRYHQHYHNKNHNSANSCNQNNKSFINRCVSSSSKSYCHINHNNYYFTFNFSFFNFLIYFLILNLFVTKFVNVVNCSMEEEKLLKNLFKGYNKLIRPVKNSSEHVVITMDLVLLQLINVVCIFEAY
jgi:hypothetical protein